MDKLRRLDVGAILIQFDSTPWVGTIYLLVNTFGFSLPELDWIIGRSR